MIERVSPSSPLLRWGIGLGCLESWRWVNQRRVSRIGEGARCWRPPSLASGALLASGLRVPRKGSVRSAFESGAYLPAAWTMLGLNPIARLSDVTASAEEGKNRSRRPAASRVRLRCERPRGTHFAYLSHAKSRKTVFIKQQALGVPSIPYKGLLT